MSLIDPSYRNLAALPSLASCTRDIYEADTRFSLDVALRMARGIASVAAHLHRQGITHGDLYGHNILWNAPGDCLLGDFGAASFHATADTLETRALQRIEVRAFGVLLGNCWIGVKGQQVRIWLNCKKLLPARCAGAAKL